MRSRAHDGFWVKAAAVWLMTLYRNLLFTKLNAFLVDTRHMEGKHLTHRTYQANFTSGGRPLGECLFLMFKDLLPLVFIPTPARAEVGACPITADFVTEPESLKTTQQVGQVAVTTTTMRTFVDGAMVQIECTGISPDQVFPDQDDATFLANYAQFWSIEPTGPAYREGDHYVIAGTKAIQGISDTYTNHLFRFADSFAMVATGVPGDGRPPGVERFFASIELVSGSPAPFTEAEVAEGRRNHVAACLPAVRADNQALELGLSDVEVTYFCSCTGQRYFAEFTRSELRALAMGDDADVEQRRLEIQTECFEDAVR